MNPSKEQQRMIAQVRAWENTCYFAVANMAGRDLVYSYFGQSCIVDFDGRMVAECGSGEGEVQYGLLSVSAIRDARKTWTAENHLYNLLHRGYTAVGPNGVSECPFDFYKNWVNDPEGTRLMVEDLVGKFPTPDKAPAPARYVP